MGYTILHLQNELRLIKQKYTIELLSFMEKALLLEEEDASKLKKERIRMLFRDARDANIKTTQEIDNLFKLPSGELASVEKAT
jgi:hypothetical protein